MRKKVFAVLSTVIFLTAGAFAIISLQSYKARAAETPAGSYYVFVAPERYFTSPGGNIRFFGSHFLPRERVTIISGGSQIGVVRADAAGNFRTGRIQVPYSAGSKVYTFTGMSSNLSFPVRIDVGPRNPWVVLNTYYAGVGTPLIVTGHQFGSSENVKVSINGLNMGFAMTTANGDFTFETVVPAVSLASRHLISVYGMSTGMVASQWLSQAY